MRDEGGQLAVNVMHFGRLLRDCGVPVGSDRVLQAIEAVEAVGVARQDDFYSALHALFVSSPRHRELFDQAFSLYWRKPERNTGLLTQGNIEGSSAVAQSTRARLAEAFANQQSRSETSRPDDPAEYCAELSWSDQDGLNQLDFEDMSSDEMRLARRVIATMKLDAKSVMTRRYRPSAIGSVIDKRSSLRASLRALDLLPLKKSVRRTRPLGLVTLCDISGSMSRYSRMILHFMHAVTSAQDSVHSFVFGTRLSNISRYLRYRDVDIALQQVADGVDDWSGGTRMGYCLEQFNRYWSRRVLAQGAVVLLISDGLDRDAGHDLEEQVKRLGHSCKKLIWLNPLMRYENYQPLSSGARALAPHVDVYQSIHNLDSMVELSQLLSHAMRSSDSRQQSMS